MPLPSGITSSWNLGFIMGVTMTLQIITGALVSFSFSAFEGFETSRYILYCTRWGWLGRLVHANGASIFFLMAYLHLFRGLVQGRFSYRQVWNSGVRALILLCGVSFLGYTLPWGQISFWGVSVITNLLSAIPFIGEEAKSLLWGNFFVYKGIIPCFFRLHILLSLSLGALAGTHILLKHIYSRGSSPLGLHKAFDLIKFSPYFTLKDTLSAWAVVMALGLVTLLRPDSLTDPDNFFPADPLTTPAHIKPEWYFLPAYAVLRSVPNKLGGVMGLVGAYAILYSLPYRFSSLSLISRERSPLRKLWAWAVATTWAIITYLGGAVVEYPFRDMAVCFSLAYFCLILPLSLCI